MARSSDGQSPRRRRSSGGGNERRGRGWDDRDRAREGDGQDEKRGRAATIRGAIASLAAIAVHLLRGLVTLVRELLRSLEGPTAELRRRVGASLAKASRVVTPARALLATALGCALLLGLSQFADYRGVAIGADNYDPSIQLVAPAPEVDRAELGSAHGYAMVPAALLAAALLAAAARRGRWQLCRLVVLIGLAAIAVSLLIDRPAGLDEGELARDFAGVEAKLLGGFWVQLFAAAGLAVAAAMLAAELKAAAASRPRARARRSRRLRAPGAEAGAEGAGA